MPLSNAERQRKFREKQKEKYGSDYILKKDADRKRHARRVNPLKTREAEKTRQKRRRANLKKNFNSSAGTTSSSCKPVSSFGQPALRLSRGQSPVKHLAVSTRDPLKLTNQRTDLYKISVNVEKAVTDFYQELDISWMTPDRNDYTIVIKMNGKERVQRRYLMMTVGDAYAVFCVKFPNWKIGLSRFASLRPANVLWFPHNVCVCQYHENLSLLLEALKPHLPSLATCYHEFLVKLFCDQENEDCTIGKCNKCQDRFSPEYSIDDDLANIQLKWFQSETVKQRTKCEKVGTVKDVLCEIKTKLQDFNQHTFVKRKQSDVFEGTILS